MKTSLFASVCYVLVTCCALAQSNLSYTVTLPAGSYAAIANQLDHGSNTLDEVLPNVPDGTSLLKWDCASQDWSSIQYQYASGFGWFPAGGTLAPGDGALLYNPANTTNLTFTGTPHVPVLPPAWPCGYGPKTMLSRQTNDVGTFENITGLSPVEGAELDLWNVSIQNFVPYTFSQNAWSPGVPSVPVGVSVLISIPCLMVQCPSNLTVECGSPWSFTEPTATSCCGTNVTVSVLNTVTNGTGCSQTITRTWQISDACGSGTQCSQTVTVVDTTPPVVSFTSITVECDDTWVMPTATAYDVCCGSNVTLISLGIVTNGGPCTNDEVISQVWQATDCCSNSITCTQTVTVLPANVVAVPLGATVTLSSPVMPAGATYQWFSQGTALPGATGPTYDVTNIDLPELSPYNVEVASSLGVLNFHWTVVTKPCIGAQCAHFNTGMTGPNANVPLAPGAADPNFVLVSEPTGAGTTAVVEGPLPGVWLPNSTGSQWIGPGFDTIQSPPGVYHYRLQFSLCCTNTASLIGRVLVDDSMGMYLNGQPAGTAASYSVWTPVNLTSGLVLGNNVLDFYVTNAILWTGLRAELTVCASCGCDPAPAGLGLWLPFDETNGPTALNLAPGGNPGTKVNNPPINSGYVLRSLCFDGASQFVSVPDYPAINVSANEDFSIDAWVKRDPASGTPVRIIADKRDANNGTGYSLSVSWGNLVFQMADGPFNYTNYRDTGTVPADNQWHFVAVTVTRNSTTGGRFYIDGAATGGTFDPTGHSGSLANTSPFEVAASAYAAGNLPWLGCIDEVEMFTRALTVQEIQGIYSAGSVGKCKCVQAPGNMTLWLPFNETSGPTAANVAPGGNNGTEINGPAINTGYVVRSLCFDGVSQYVTVPDYAAIDPGAGQNFSIDAWIRRDPASGTTVRVVADKRDPNTGIGYSLAVSYGNLIFQMNDGSGYTNWRDSGVIPADNTWHLVAVSVIRSQTNGGRFYIDGSLTSTFDPTPYPASLATTAPFLVGNTFVAGASPWLGCIDEPEFFLRAITSQEVLGLYNARSAGKCTNCTSGLVLSCATNKTVECSTQWGFDAPTASSCCGTNTTLVVLSTVTNGVGHITFTGGGSTADGVINIAGGAAISGYLNITAGSKVGTYTLSPGSGSDLLFAWDGLVYPGSDPFLDSSGLLFTGGGSEINLWGNGPGSYTLAGAPPSYSPNVTNGIATLSLCPQVITRTWAASDLCGNTNTCSQTVTVVDTVPPVITGLTNKTVECGSSWTFDTPSASDACCGKNVSLSLLSTVTNGTAPCSLEIVQTWVATDCCGNSTTNSEVVTIRDTTPPVFATSCVTNVIFQGGGNNFTTPVPASPSAGLLTRLHKAGITVFKGYDQCTVNSYFATTLTNLPHCITAATLEVRLKPCGDICENDAIGLSFTSPSGVLQTNASWYSYLGSGNPSPGLDSDNWCNHTSGQTFVLNLASLPNTGANLLAQLNANGYLDFYCQDDSGVDYLKLTVTSCCYQPSKTVECGSQWTFDPPTASDACCGANVTVTVYSTVTNGTCPKVATRTWKATDCCGNSSFFSQTVTMVDTTPPVVHCPGPITRYVCGTSLRVYYYAWAYDACSGYLPVNCTPPSGSLFPVGTTMVSCTATDACGHVGSCSFPVTVVNQTIYASAMLGLPDCFKLPTEPAPKSAQLVAAYPAGTCWRPFDNLGVNCDFGVSFMGLPANITCGQLIIRMRPNCSDIPQNDAISVGLNTNKTFGWSSYIGAGNPGPGLTTATWCGQDGCGQTFTMNLASMPNTGANLLPVVNTSHTVDVFVQDDTGVDYAQLNYCYCRTLPWWQGWEWNTANAELATADTFASFSPLWSLGYPTNFSLTLAPQATHGIQLAVMPLNLGAVASSSLTVSGQTTMDPSASAISLTGDGSGNTSIALSALRPSMTQVQLVFRQAGAVVSQTTLPATLGTALVSIPGGASVQALTVQDDLPGAPAGDQYSVALDGVYPITCPGCPPPFVSADEVDLILPVPSDTSDNLLSSLTVSASGITEIQVSGASAEVSGAYPQAMGDGVVSAGPDELTITPTVPGSSNSVGFAWAVPASQASVSGFGLALSQNLNPPPFESNGVVEMVVSGQVGADVLPAITILSRQTNDSQIVSADFSALSPTALQFSIKEQGVTIAQVTSPGGVGLVPGTPPIPWPPYHGSVYAGSNATSVALSWPESISFSLGGTNYTGDELDITTVSPDLPLTAITGMQVQASGVDALTISSIGPPALIWILQPPTITPSQMTIQWSGPPGGTLESAPSVLGPWKPVPGQGSNSAVLGSPLTNGVPVQYFRVNSN